VVAFGDQLKFQCKGGTQIMPKNKALVPVEKIENKILLIRGEKVIIDADLAEQLQEVVI